MQAYGNTKNQGSSGACIANREKKHRPADEVIINLIYRMHVTS